MKKMKPQQDFALQHKQPLGLFVLIVLLLAVFQPALANVEFEVEYQDTASTGFLATTPVTPVGGNQGTTLGEQRRIALEHALGEFAERLSSSVPIHIQARFQNLGGSSSSAILASAGPEWFNYNFKNAPARNIAYPSALANKLSGMDLSDQSKGIADVNLTINADIDGAALGNSTYYYGLDGRSPRFDIDFITVITHELIHGLGFLSAIDPLTGHKFGCSQASCRTNDIGDIFSTFLARQTQASQTPTPLLNMTQSQRLAAVTANGQIIWTGNFAQAQSTNFLTGLISDAPKIYAPSPLELGSSLSHTDLSLSPAELMQPSYSGSMGLSYLSLAMLADLGWGTAGDLKITLRELEPYTPSNGTRANRVLASVSHAQPTTSTLNGIEVLFSILQGSLTVEDSQGADLCSKISSLKVRCQLSSLLPAQITDITLRVQDAASSKVTAVITGNLLELEPSDNTVQLVVMAPPEVTAPEDEQILLENNTADDSSHEDSSTDSSNQDDATQNTNNNTATSNTQTQTPNSTPMRASQSGGSVNLWMLLLLASFFTVHTKPFRGFTIRVLSSNG